MGEYKYSINLIGATPFKLEWVPAELVKYAAQQSQEYVYVGLVEQLAVPLGNCHIVVGYIEVAQHLVVTRKLQNDVQGVVGQVVRCQIQSVHVGVIIQLNQQLLQSFVGYQVLNQLQQPYLEGVPPADVLPNRPQI